jgi:hypothetical protein
VSCWGASGKEDDAQRSLFVGFEENAVGLARTNVSEQRVASDFRAEPSEGEEER